MTNLKLYETGRGLHKGSPLINTAWAKKPEKCRECGEGERREGARTCKECQQKHWEKVDQEKRLKERVEAAKLQAKNSEDNAKHNG